MSRSSLFGVVLLTVVLSVLATLAVLYGLVTRYSPEALLGSDGEVNKTSGSVTALMQDSEETVSIPDVVAKTIPAVVSVVITAEVPIIERYYEEFNPFGGFFGGGFQVPRQRQIGTEEREIGGGTGFFVSSDGYIVTNKHVVDQDGVSYSIVTNEGESHAIEVVARDPMLDIAILRVTDSEETFPFLTFAEGEVRLGEEVIAIGNALAEFPNSVSVGVISGVARNIMASAGFGRSESLESLIQTDAAINQGNSGGPLLNTQGEVVGVNVAMAGGSENIGFSLPAPMVREVYESVAEFGEIRRPYLGVRYLQLTEDVIARNNLDVEYGVLIVRGESRADLAVLPGSPADKAGLEENDIILKLDDIELRGERSFASILRDYAVGDTVTLTVLSDGEEEVVEVMLEAAPEG